MGVDEWKEKLKAKINSIVENKYEQWIEEYRNQSIKDLLPAEIQNKIGEKLPLISVFIIEKGIDYFSSDEGKKRIGKLVEDFIHNRGGMLKNMLQMLLGNVNLTDKIQPEVIKFLKNKGTEELITNVLKNEWEKVLEWKGEKLEEQFDKQNIIGMMQNNINKMIKVDTFMNTSLQQLTVKIQAPIVGVIQKGVEKICSLLADRMEEIFKKLRLAEIVQNQVEKFPIERLEEMLLSIISSELKMITYMGALLGGVIGVFQGIIAVLF